MHERLRRMHVGAMRGMLNIGPGRAGGAGGERQGYGPKTNETGCTSRVVRTGSERIAWHGGDIGGGESVGQGSWIVLSTGEKEKGCLAQRRKGAKGLRQRLDCGSPAKPVFFQGFRYLALRDEKG